MRIVLSGGGTGGHIYPSITIAKAISRLEHTDILFIGTKEGLEADIIPKEGFNFATIDVRGFERRFSLPNMITVAKAASSIWRAKDMIDNFKPDIVIGTGGYVCGPVLMAACWAGVPTLIQEQNAIPGITNKLLSYFVDKIAIGYHESATYFYKPEKTFFSGNPIRNEVLTAHRENGIRELGLKQDKLTLLVSGGSRGARSINSAMIAVHKYFSNHNDIQILHITGQNEYNSLVGNLVQSGIDITGVGNSMIRPYLYNMPSALAVADLAIFRAGAIGLAELTARGVPAILIPYPFAAANHQEFNARILEKKGAAKVIRDSELTGEVLIENIERLLKDRVLLANMSEASRAMGHPHAADVIAQQAFQLQASREK